MCSLPVSFNTWINEANVIFIVQILSSFFGDCNELLKSVCVGKVIVKVVLVMFELVHLFNCIVVVSNFGEGEAVVVQFLGGDGEFGRLSFFLKATLDFHGIVPVLHIEVSGKLTKLVV